MNTYIHKQFYRTIINLEDFDSILIAISGGQDSICLIKLIEDFSNRYNLRTKIEYIYIDHQWKKDSKFQTQHLINYLKEKNHHLSIYQIQVTAYSELEARNLRYQLILQHAIKYDFSMIMTAHTKTDRIETFLQKLIRGTSLDGVIGLNYKRKISKNLQIIRPLIMITRMDLNWFCRKFALPIWSDHTNYYYNINRNRLRHELVPYLRKYHMQNIESQISQFIDYSKIDNEYIKQSTVKLYLLIRHSVNIAINYHILQKQHIAIQIRLLQIFFYHNFNKILNRIILDKLLDIINNNEIKKDVHIIQWNNLLINIYNNWVYIT